jgi:DNA-directed RNA polymerase specialized sigma24 family protein
METGGSYSRPNEPDPRWDEEDWLRLWRLVEGLGPVIRRSLQHRYPRLNGQDIEDAIASALVEAAELRMTLDLSSEADRNRFFRTAVNNARRIDYSKARKAPVDVGDLVVEPRPPASPESAEVLAVKAACDELPDDQRDLLNIFLNVYTPTSTGKNGAPWAVRAADALKCTPGNARVKLSRLLKQIREKLGWWRDGGPA